MAKSVKNNIPDAKFIVCFLEKEHTSLADYEYFDDVVLAKDTWNGNFDQFIFKHSIVEASTSVKGNFFNYLFEKFPEESDFVYLDPDIYVYSDFIELKEVLKTRPIVLCPHLLQPGNIDMELSSTAHGVYNLGFLAVNKSFDEAKRFINWWAERLYLFCYDDKENGVFTDQKWIDLAPSFFDVEIFKHRGYNFAPWSLLDCGMTNDNGEILIKGDPLRFIHFSGYGRTAEKCMNDWLPEGPHPFKTLYAEYAELHDANNSDKVSKTKWAYDFYENGEKIEDILRVKYRKNHDIMFNTDNPFKHSNGYFENILTDKAIPSKDFKNNLTKVVSVYKKEGLRVVVNKIKKNLK
ncbi:hypothetical protein [Solibacillus cecembensis]|uniref:hypothetical protein n=1 Tax=Solibacillus cecembensis TaxID=459347 RepID=UPI003D0124F2